ncbi:hypothetical protein R5R35_000385 [Gryllus longicercus]|uniref:HIG1 domain-containing protein n=1 Tax=Gryllus longicercus TaxID=2509291 RepID=A0AAN9VEF9_9ORTH
MENKNDSSSTDLSQFDWLQLKKDIDSEMKIESTEQKFIRKFKENPLVPIGCTVTLGALTYGLWSFRHGRSQMSQYMMRLRIVAQGFTIVAMLVGIGLAAKRAKPDLS